jgi:hypothetical protein
MLFFFLNSNNIFAPAQGKAEIVGKAYDHFYRRIDFSGFHEPYYGIKGIVKKMGIDLGLHKCEFCLSALLFLFRDFPDQLCEPLHHVFNTVGKDLYFLNVSLDGFTDGQTSLPYGFEAFTNHVNRIHNPAA